MKSNRPKRFCLSSSWRIDYILGPKEKGCFFCKAAKLKKNDEKAWKKFLLLYRDSKVIVMLNRYPYTAGHIMVAPLKHTADFEKQSQATHIHFALLEREILRILKKEIKPDGINMGMNLGKSAGAGVEDHLHSHVVPRWDGDTNFMPVLAGAHSVPIALDELWEQFRPQFKKIKINP